MAKCKTCGIAQSCLDCLRVERGGQRLRLVQDDSCHWYAIPADKGKQFDKWVQTFGWGEHEYRYKGPDFSEYRLGSHLSVFTFTDLKEDQ